MVARSNASMIMKRLKKSCKSCICRFWRKKTNEPKHQQPEDDTKPDEARELENSTVSVEDHSERCGGGSGVVRVTSETEENKDNVMLEYNMKHLLPTSGNRRSSDLTSYWPSDSSHCTSVSNTPEERPTSSCPFLYARNVPDRQSDSSTRLQLQTVTNSVSETCTDLTISDNFPLQLACFEGVSLREIAVVRTEVAREALLRYPNYYDFCIVASDEDYERASDFKHHLAEMFNLVGCMLHDDETFFSLGTDIFYAYEAMMRNSSKVFFYMSEYFDPVHLRLQSGAMFQSLMSTVKKNKCAPIFPNGVREVPIPLSGIAGLEPHKPFMLKRLVNATFTVDCRRSRLETQNCRIMYRNAYFIKQLSYRIQKCITFNEVSQKLAFKPTLDTTLALPQRSPHPADSELDTYQSTVQQILSSLSIQDEERENLNQIICEQLVDINNQNVPATSIQISGSSKIHVGNKVVVNINTGSSRKMSDELDDSEESNSGSECSCQTDSEGAEETE